MNIFVEIDSAFTRLHFITPEVEKELPALGARKDVDGWLLPANKMGAFLAVASRLGFEVYTFSGSRVIPD